MSTDPTDALFAQIRRNSFDSAPDTFATAPIGSNQIAPNGWYDLHQYSSSPGQSNLLLDPVFDTLGAYPSSSAISTTVTTVGSWSCISVLNSGSSPTLKGLGVGGQRGQPNGPGGTPFNSATSYVSAVADATGDVNVYTYPGTDLTPSSIPAFDWLVAGIKVFRQDALTGAFTTATVTLEILKGGVVVASSDTHDLTTDTSGQIYTLTAAYSTTASDFQASTWRWRLNVHYVVGSADSSTLVAYFGEPQISYNYTPTLLPFSPLLGGWSPSIFYNPLYIANRKTSTISGTVNDWDPGLSTSTYFHLSTSGTPIITGILAPGAKGRVIYLAQGDPATVTLKHDSASSSAANRFRLPGSADATIVQYQNRQLIYTDASRWELAS